MTQSTTPRTRRFLIGFAIAALASLVLTLKVTAVPEAELSVEASSSDGVLQPTTEHRKVAQDIARHLQYQHYQEIRIDADSGTEIFDNFIKALDPQRVYFTDADIKAFQSDRSQFKTILEDGKLEIPFAIYDRYQKRHLNRLNYMLSRLEEGLDALPFDSREFIELDRSEAPWAVTDAEYDAIWDKRLANAVISMRLNDKEDSEILEELKRRYERQAKRLSQVNSEDVFQVYMNAVTNTFDPHTQYLSPRISENFNINMSLSLEGIGAVLQVDEEFTRIVRLVPGGPADRHGVLKPSDRIVGVGQGSDGEIVNVSGWRLEDVVDLIRGPRDSTVRLEILPASAKIESETRQIAIVRDKVKLEDQAAQSDLIEIERDGVDFKVGIIQIPHFYADWAALQAGDPEARSTTRDVLNHILELRQKGMDALIIDLRNNGGGALSEATGMVGLFIDQGPTVQVRSADGRVGVKADPYAGVAWTGPLAVMVNRMSASASEIFAAAIQDYGRGLILGEQTFGKGTVQSVRELSHGRLKITDAKFYRVSGGSTQHKGVIPDITFPSAIDKTEIGEDALPAALPWDQIDAVKFRQASQLTSRIDALTEAHRQRMNDNPEFNVLLKEIEYTESLRAIDRVSLDETTRRKQLQEARSTELELANLRREAQGETVFEDYAAYEEWLDNRNVDGGSRDIVDFLSREAADILFDSTRVTAQLAEH